MVYKGPFLLCLLFITAYGLHISIHRILQSMSSLKNLCPFLSHPQRINFPSFEILSIDWYFSYVWTLDAIISSLGKYKLIQYIGKIKKL